MGFKLKHCRSQLCSVFASPCGPLPSVCSPFPDSRSLPTDMVHPGGFHKRQIVSDSTATEGSCPGGREDCGRLVSTWLLGTALSLRSAIRLQSDLPRLKLFSVRQPALCSTCSEPMTSSESGSSELVCNSCSICRKCLSMSSLMHSQSSGWLELSWPRPSKAWARTSTSFGRAWGIASIAAKTTASSKGGVDTTNCAKDHAMPTRPWNWNSETRLCTSPGNSPMTGSCENSKLANAHSMLAKACGGNSAIRACAASAMDPSSVASLYSRRAKAHDRFDNPCAWKLSASRYCCALRATALKTVPSA
mmetsp:Transcript_71385/g.167127  ORF Transcript_71385/g.167127 Transcript_71385/m.167127 type:complete len:305 (+) Transcript_71385:633-1547(+)